MLCGAGHPAHVYHNHGGNCDKQSNGDETGDRQYDCHVISGIIFGGRISRSIYKRDRFLSRYPRMRKSFLLTVIQKDSKLEGYDADCSSVCSHL